MVKNSAVVYKIPAGTFEIEGGIHLVFIKFCRQQQVLQEL